jgi:FkbM family methyltransferase
MTSHNLIATYWATFNKHGYNEIHPPLLALLHEVGRTSDFVDVGANVGDTAMGVSEAIETLGLNTHVHSFEPGPIFDLARANIALNQLDERISLHRVAASDSIGYLPMHIMVGHTESGSVGGISAHYDIPVGETRFVRAARLDAFLPDDGRSYCIKIDAEGVDFAVIRGAAGLIASGRAPILTLEFTPKYNLPADMDTARSLLTDYAMFNLRGIDHAGHFDCFDPVSAEEFDAWVAAVAASPHGWTDVAYVSRGLLDTAPMASFLDGYKHYTTTRNATLTTA